MLASAHQTLTNLYNVSNAINTPDQESRQSPKTNGKSNGGHKVDSAATQAANGTDRLLRISFLGLGAMGSGMATALIRAGFAVTGYDLYRACLDRFGQSGGRVANSVAEATTDADLIIMMVQSAAQIDSLLFDDPAIERGISKGCKVLVMSTVPPAYIKNLGERLGRIGVEVVDAPVSGGVARAAAGDLLIMASGSESALSSVSPALKAMSGKSENLCLIKGGLGAGSSVKML